MKDQCLDGKLETEQAKACGQVPPGDMDEYTLAWDSSAGNTNVGYFHKALEDLINEHTKKKPTRRVTKHTK